MTTSYIELSTPIEPEKIETLARVGKGEFSRARAVIKQMAEGMGE